MLHSTPDSKVNYYDPAQGKLACQHTPFLGKIVDPMCSEQTSSGCKEQSAALSSYMQNTTRLFSKLVSIQNRDKQTLVNA